MRRWIKMMLIVFALLLIIVLGVAYWYLSKALPIGTGYVAKYLCSNVFISQRDPDVVFAEDIKPVNPLAHIIKWRVDQKEKSVTASGLGFSSTALFCPGRGCILVNGISDEELTTRAYFQPFDRKTAVHDPNIDWPLGDGPPLNPAELGINAKKLNTALDYAFSEPSPDRFRRTSAVLVAYDGHLIAERYARGFTANTPVLGWSMTKSVTSALVGVLVNKGLLNINDRAPVAEWSDPNDPRHQITLDQLLRMSSGLDFEEKYMPLYDATAMLYGAADFAAFAAAKPLKNRPDSVLSYSC